MKNVTTTLLFVMLSVCQINAQKKGDFILGGSFGYSTNKMGFNMQNGGKENILIAPIIGTMLNERISVGAELGYANLDNDADGFGDPNIEVLSISPFLRHQENISPKFKVYGEPHCGFAINLADRTKYKTQIYNLGYNIGLAYFFTPRLSVELNLIQLEYLTTYDPDTHIENSSLLFKYNIIDSNIGFKLYF